MYTICAQFMGGENVAMCNDKDRHSFKKRVLSQALSDNALREMEDQILEIIKSFCEKVITGSSIEKDSEVDKEECDAETRRWSSPKDMADWSDYLTSDILSTLCFGRSFAMLDRDTNRWIPDTLREATSGLCTVALNILDRQAQVWQLMLP